METTPVSVASAVVTAADVIPNYAAWLTIPQVAVRCGVPATRVRDWIQAGVKKTGGGRLHLAATKVGGHWRVRPEDVAPFFGAITADCLPATAANPPAAAEPAAAKETPAQARRRAEACMDRLRARGVIPPAAPVRKPSEN